MSSESGPFGPYYKGIVYDIDRPGGPQISSENVPLTGRPASRMMNRIIRKQMETGIPSPEDIEGLKGAVLAVTRTLSPQDNRTLVAVAGEIGVSPSLLSRSLHRAKLDTEKDLEELNLNPGHRFKRRPGSESGLRSFSFDDFLEVDIYSELGITRDDTTAFHIVNVPQWREGIPDSAPRVLIIDDIPEQLLDSGDNLSQVYGIKVQGIWVDSSTYSAEKNLMLQRQLANVVMNLNPDVVIVDKGLGYRIDGIQLCEDIREARQGNLRPAVIMLTGEQRTRDTHDTADILCVRDRDNIVEVIRQAMALLS